MLEQLYKLEVAAGTANEIQLLMNHVLERVTNLLYPIYCKFVAPRKNISLHLSEEAEIIVSLTTFPARIDKCYLCINSILRQHKKADRVILWLAKEQFPLKSGLPDKLLTLEKYGLEIKFCDDLKSFKKIFYTAQDYVNSIIITADDDVLYPEYWIEQLYNKYVNNRNCVICYRAALITFDKNDNIQPYLKWRYDAIGPAFLLVPTGVGGILYPPGYFEDIDFDYNIIKKLCPTMDDLWLKVVGILNGYPSLKIDQFQKEWFSIKSTQHHSLMKINVNSFGDSANDRALQNLLQYYQIDLKEYATLDSECQ